MIYAVSLMAISCLAGFVEKRSRVISVLIVVVMWILMGFNTMNADYTQYQYLYDFKMLDASGVNAGYLVAEELAWAIGLDFLQFRMLFAAFGLALIALFVRRYSSCPNVALALYSLLPFMYDVVQFKFFLAASVAIYSLRFLIDRSRLYGLKFATGIFMATLVHPAAFLFTAFGIGLLDRRRALKASLFAAMLALMAVYGGFAQYASSFFLDSTKQSAYMTELGRFGWIPYFVSVVGGVIVAHFASPFRYALEPRGDDSGEARFFHFFESAKYVFLPLLALLPLSVQNFYRPLRSGNLLILMYLSSFAFGRQKDFPNAEKTALIIFSIAWLAFTQVVLYRGVIDVVIVTEFANNLLWS